MSHTYEGNFLFLGESRCSSSEVRGVKSKRNVLNRTFIPANRVGGCRIVRSIDQQGGGVWCHDDGHRFHSEFQTTFEVI